MRESTIARDIVLPDDVLKMDDISSFLFLNENGKIWIVAFAAQNEKRILTKCETLIIDGTFKISPQQFTQVYTMLANNGNKVSEIKAVPVVCFARK